MPQPVYLTEDIRHIEQANSALPLMERAGAAAAELAITLLSDKGKDVLVLAGPGNNGGDAKVVARILQEKFFRVTLADSVPAEKKFNLVVDGLFGIGLTRPIDGAYAKLVDYANAQSCPVLTLDGPDHCGQISVADLALQKGGAAKGWIAEPSLFKNVLRARPGNFHKGMAGSVGI